MKKQLIIRKTCDKKERPAYSWLIDEYLEDFLNEHILIPFKIINGTKWTIWLSMMYFTKGKYGPQGVYVFKPTTVSGENVKFYPIQIPYEEVFVNDKVVENVVRLYFEAFKLFFTSNYKKISLGYLNELEKKIDWHYILSLPYPVEIKDQHYVGDIAGHNTRQL